VLSADEKQVLRTAGGDCVLTSVDSLDRNVLLVDELETPVGTLLLAACNGKLRALEFTDRGYENLGRLKTDLPRRNVRDPFGFSTAIQEYFNGDSQAMDKIPVDLDGTAFQQRVWLALRDIPEGTTISYAQLAFRVGSPKACRAVGITNGRNPIAVVLPCHRVIGSNGTLTGYGGGLARKEWLLRHEGAIVRQLQMDKST
jgi:methylated-DNA-[protein]-cysteine S-methyltransferase